MSKDHESMFQDGHFKKQRRSKSESKAARPDDEERSDPASGGLLDEEFDWTSVLSPHIDYEDIMDGLHSPASTSASHGDMRLTTSEVSGHEVHSLVPSMERIRFYEPSHDASFTYGALSTLVGQVEQHPWAPPGRQEGRIGAMDIAQAFDVRALSMSGPFRPVLLGASLNMGLTEGTDCLRFSRPSSPASTPLAAIDGPIPDDWDLE